MPRRARRPSTPRPAPPEAVTATRDGPCGRILWMAVQEVSAVTLQRAVRRSGILDRGFVLL
jgi:hypothetical protein